MHGVQAFLLASPARQSLEWLAETAGSWFAC